jgi:DsbC/DsbD-like thiol-disulfide interchange protein
MSAAGMVCALAAGPGAQTKDPFAGAPAASASGQTRHLQFRASIEGAAAPGRAVTVSVEVTPNKGMHVYAPGKHDYQVVQLSIDAQPWLSSQPTVYPPSEIYDFKELNEKVEVYSKTFKLSRAVTLLASPEAKKELAGKSSVTFTGTLEYQACDDKVCYNPAKAPVSITVPLAQ